MIREENISKLSKHEFYPIKEPASMLISSPDSWVVVEGEKDQVRGRQGDMIIDAIEPQISTTDPYSHASLIKERS